MPPRALITTRRAEPLRGALASLGLDGVHVALLDTRPTGRPPPGPPPDLALVTSATTARCCATLAQALGGAPVVAVGARTAAALRSVGAHVVAVGAAGGPEAVALMRGMARPSDRVWYVGALAPSAPLAAALDRHVPPVARWAVYETVVPAGLEAALRAVGPLDVALIASGSAARAFCLHAARPWPRVVVLGPQTAAEARAAGLAVHGVARTRDLDALALAAAAAVSGTASA